MFRLDSSLSQTGTLGESLKPNTPTLLKDLPVSTSRSISLTHSTSTPSNPQSLTSGSPSPTASNQPMSPSAITSVQQSSISSQPTRITPKPGDSPVADTDSTSMSSSSSSSRQVPPTNTRGDIDAPPRPTSATAPGSSPPAKPATTSTKNNVQNSGAGSTKPTPPTTVRAGASTTVAIVSVRPSNTSTVFKTITSSPETTLSVPSSIPVTNSVNGAISLTAPPLVTVMSTFTGADGALVTFTHLVANPPDSVNTSKTSTGFLEHHGQVAGVFTVVGIVATALVVALIWFIRRYRRKQRRRAWFASLRQYPPSPFADSYREAHEGSHMRSIQTTSEVIHDPHMVSYNNSGYRPQSPPESTEGSMGLGLTGVGTATRGVIVPLRRPLSGGDPFRDPPHVPQNTPVSFSPNRDRFNELSGASIAPSSPSIYPESLPPTDDSPSPIDSEPKSQIKPFPEPLLRRSLSVPSRSEAPPRPPRSHLRESQKSTDIIPLTPPASLSSHGHSKLESPESHFTALPTRRAMLHVRPRTAPESDSPTSQASRGTFGEQF